jgi:hypothetical protein
VDGRHRRGSRTSPPASPASTAETIELARRGSDVSDIAASVSVCREICYNTDLLNSSILKSDLEVVSFQHFMDDFMPLLTLSNSHPGFQRLIPEMVDMALRFDGMKDIILACGASHMHLLTGNREMNEAGIRFYARAVSGVSRSLSRIDWSQDDFNDSLLLAIILLYIHGVS